ncbi:GCN5-related N-acetyltransferase [Catenulispora acidiphila DSM 44928]|uniref:GCN5-related N-acetyltransferase n=1 Tax=Catenulispora acidiphila (strain DSM 44928 / JCM 14897 / NBRC 102108 / NRRL B-24433 / ID139908) TaxID=479433 RepID=C7Q1B3_CATAD|nr:GNAT family N-acetyltransferase [Catenulispora acidiphila]ACU73642.1 GCN5-related N-acetyltransferase [Catenulispora acidiphila DSM 44928]
MTSPTTDKALLALFDHRMRATADPDEPAARVEHIDGIVRQIGAHPTDWHGIVYADIDATTADAAIQAQIAHFRTLGADFEWKHYSHDEPADLPARLQAAGFEADEPETLFVAEITQLSGAGLTETLPEGITLRPVTTEADADLVAEAANAAFGSGGDRARARVLARLAADPETVWTWLAMAGDRPVSAARMLIHPGTAFASLWGGGTAPEWRGRGIYRALVARRMQVAAELGCEYLQVDATDMSRPILERLGFRALSVTTPYEYRF